MKSNIVSSREFEAGSSVPFARLDAEFVDPDSLQAERDVETHPSVRLSTILDRTSSRTFPPLVDEDEMVRYIAIDNVDTDDGLCFQDTIRAGDLPSRAKYLTKQGDMLLSNVRPTRGAIALIGARTEAATASSGFTLLRLSEPHAIPLSFVYACLRSKYVSAQLDRRTRNSMYPAVSEGDVLQLILPTPPRKLRTVVDDHVRSAFAEQQSFYRAHDLMNEMVERLLKDYLLPPSPVAASSTQVHATVVSSDDVFGAGGAQRIDAEFFRREYAEVDADIRQRGRSFLLGEHFELSTGRALGPGDEECPYVKQAVLTNVGINWSALVCEQGTPGPRRARVRSGDILLACTAHEIFYIGRKVDFVRDVPVEIEESNTCVADLMIIRPKSTKPAELFGSYVAAFLRHDIGRHQVQRCIRGLRGGHVYRDDLARYVRIPFPKRKWLETFEDRAIEMETHRNNAKTYIRRAVAAVDDHITAIVGRA